MQNPTPKLRYSVEECLEALGISRKTFYDRIRAGTYQTITDGRRRFMTHEQLVAASKGDTPNDLDKAQTD